MRAATQPCLFPRRPTLTRTAMAVLGRLEAFLPAMQAANEALKEEDATSHDIEELSDPDGPHIEMVRHPGPSPCTRRRAAHDPAQNLACGVLEAKAPAEADVATTEQSIDELRLPTRQTAAVASAAQAGRVLVSEVAEDQRAPPPKAKRPAGAAGEEGATSDAKPAKTRKQPSA